MFTKKTIIGIAIGSFVVGFGIILLIQTFTTAYQVNDTVDIGKSDIFDFDANQHSREILNVTGNSFHVKLQTPSTGLQVNDDFTKEVSFDWVVLQEGKNFINITNTGSSTLQVTGKLYANPKFLETLSPLISISTGILIIGISAAFSVRKPRGF